MPLNRNNKNEKYRIERNDSLQIEKDLVTGVEVKLSIVWVDDCEYHLSFIERPTKMKETFESYTNKLIIKTIRTTKNGYEYLSRFEGSD